MGLGQLGCHPLRAGVDPGDRIAAAATSRPDAALAGGYETTWAVCKLDAGRHLVGPWIDAHHPVAVGDGHPERVTASDQAHVLGATEELRAQTDRRDHSVGGGIDSRDARPARLGDPNGPWRDCDPGRLRPDV